MTGAQKGLILSITPKGSIVDWPGAQPHATSSDPFRLVGMVEILPFQNASTLPSDEDGSTEILTSITTVESETCTMPSHSREVFMVRQPPQIPMTEAPDIQSGDEDLSNISLDALPPVNETDDQKMARERKNKAR